MNLAHLWNQTFPVAPHTVLAIIALLLGAIQLWRPKGTGSHRVIGYLWVGLMAWVASSGLFIHEIRLWGPLSPIHLLSILVLTSLWFAVQAARRGRIHLHKRIMSCLFVFALVITGAFTLLPGRVMHVVLLGS